MDRGQGYRVRLVKQATEYAEERGDDAPEFLMGDDGPQLFPTESDAIDAAQTYVASRPKLTYLVEAVEK